MSARICKGCGGPIPPDRARQGGPEHECQKCEYGLIEHIVAGSASKTETSFCTCPIGQARKADTIDALEAKGEERGR